MTSRPIVRPRCFRRFLVPVAVAMLNVGALAVAVPPVAAQPSEARGFITVNGGLQAAVADFSDSIALEHALFGPEAGEVATRYRGGGDTLFRRRRRRPPVAPTGGRRQRVAVLP